MSQLHTLGVHVTFSYCKFGAGMHSLQCVSICTLAGALSCTVSDDRLEKPTLGALFGKHWNHGNLCTFAPYLKSEALHSTERPAPSYRTAKTKSWFTASRLL